jgi:hypothetical protein
LLFVNERMNISYFHWLHRFEYQSWPVPTHSPAAVDDGLFSPKPLLVCPSNDGFAEHHVPLKRFVSGMQLGVFRQLLEARIIIPAPRNELPHHLVVDVFDGQFSSVLASERVRDKVAASRKKGKWTGGTVPLGYDAKEKKLVINKSEAQTVRTIFQLYLELRSFGKLVAELDRRRIVTKRRDSKIAKYRGGIPSPMVPSPIS